MQRSNNEGLDNILKMMGNAGKRLLEIQAVEGAAGNLSVCLRRPIDPGTHFPMVEQIELPLPVPELAGATFMVTGSGRRLPEIIDEPLANLGCLIVEEGGRTGRLHTSPQRRFERLTSEFNSHLAVHHDRMRADGIDFHAIIHAQPPYLTYLSHIARYQDEDYLNTHLLRWQPETIINFPEGFGVVPFLIPGSPELMERTTRAMREHTLVVWVKHGVMARSEASIDRAADKVEYAEAAARYEYLNLCTAEAAGGLTPDEIRAICAAFKVQQQIF